MNRQREPSFPYRQLRRINLFPLTTNLVTPRP